MLGSFLLVLCYVATVHGAVSPAQAQCNGLLEGVSEELWLTPGETGEMFSVIYASDANGTYWIYDDNNPVLGKYYEVVILHDAFFLVLVLVVLLVLLLFSCIVWKSGKL